MNHILLVGFILSVFYIFLILAKVLFFEVKKSTFKKMRINLPIAIVCIILFFLSYVPHAFSSFHVEDITTIIVKDGETGLKLEITDPDEINHIIENLNNIMIQKRGNAFFYLGYGFDVELYNKNGIEKRVIINASDTIRYRAFFYDVIEGEIDYEYFEKLFAKAYSK